MSKYKYNKKALKGLSVGPFLKEVKLREEKISQAEPLEIKTQYNANVLADKLHPSHINGKIKKIIIHSKDCKTFVIEPNEQFGFNALPYFRAGQYISLGLTIGTSFVSRPYTLSSNPALAIGEKNNEYHITIKRKPDGFVSNYLLDKSFEGMELLFSAPLGDFYYSGIRDSKTVVALAGGSGITPFISMASAISTGIEDFNLTIIYGSKNKNEILLKEKLEDIAKASKGKVKVVYVLSGDDEKIVQNTKSFDDCDEEVLIMEKSDSSITVDKDGNVSEIGIKEKPATIEELENEKDDNIYEKGFITSDIIKKYAPSDDFSLFVCGPKAMYDFLEGEISKLNIPKRRVRFEVPGEFGDPKVDRNYPLDAEKEFVLKLIIHGETKEIKCKSSETLINAIEKAGVRVTTDCRSGECGWCHSRLVSGDIFIPTGRENRRAGDKKFNWIHPCITYPLSDIEMEVFPV